MSQPHDADLQRLPWTDALVSEVVGTTTSGDAGWHPGGEAAQKRLAVQKALAAQKALAEQKGGMAWHC
jgi:hypothetical protein